LSVEANDLVGDLVVVGKKLSGLGILARLAREELRPL